MTGFWTLAAIFVSNFIYIGLKAYQQLNVVNHDLRGVFVTSNLMAAAEIYLISRYAALGPALPLVLAVGISGGLGCMTSMLLRRRVTRQ